MRATLLLALVAASGLACGASRPERVEAAAASAAASPASAPTAPVAPARPPLGARAAAFSAPRAWSMLEAQLAMGPRAQGLPGKEKVRAFLREKLAAHGAEVSELRFSHRGRDDAKASEFVNVMGRFNPKAERWVLLGTHYDTRLWGDEDANPDAHARPIEGANDGASGTAVLLEIATVLSEMPPDIGVLIVFYDGEDYGKRGHGEDYFLGSEAHAARWTEFHGTSRPLAAVVLDMVGDADLRFRREAKAEAAFPWLNDLLWNTAQAHGARAFADGQQGVTDDHDALMAIGIPATLLIDFEYPYWHTAADTADKCSPESLAITGRVVLDALIDQPLVVPPAQ